MKRLLSILPLVFVLGIPYSVSAQEKAEPTTSPVEDRVAKLEEKLEAAMQRIETLETELQELKKGMQDAKSQRPAKPAKPVVPQKAAEDLDGAAFPQSGSRWRGPRAGNLSSGQPLPGQGAPVDAQVVEGSDQKFVIKLEVRKDLIFTATCVMSNGRWVLDRVDANPAGAGRPGPVAILDSYVTYKANEIEIFWKTGPSVGTVSGNGKETYKLRRLP